MIDYATCSKIHHENIIKLLVDVHEEYQIKNKNKSDHNTILPPHFLSIIAKRFVLDAWQDPEHIFVFKTTQNLHHIF